jgi:hypothetical protein
MAVSVDSRRARAAARRMMSVNLDYFRVEGKKIGTGVNRFICFHGTATALYPRLKNVSSINCHLSRTTVHSQVPPGSKDRVTGTLARSVEKNLAFDRFVKNTIRPDGTPGRFSSPIRHNGHYGKGHYGGFLASVPRFLRRARRVVVVQPLS